MCFSGGGMFVKVSGVGSCVVIVVLGCVDVLGISG